MGGVSNATPGSLNLIVEDRKGNHFLHPDSKEHSAFFGDVWEMCDGIPAREIPRSVEFWKQRAIKVFDGDLSDEGIIILTNTRSLSSKAFIGNQ